MHPTVIKEFPELYKKLKPYIDTLESMGFVQDRIPDKYYREGDDENYIYFNDWEYRYGKEDNETLYIADLASYTGEPKIEIYCYKIEDNPFHKECIKEKKPIDYYGTKSLHRYTFKALRKANGYEFKSIIINDIKTFKKELGKVLKQIVTFQEKNKMYEMEKMFK